MQKMMIRFAVLAALGCFLIAPAQAQTVPVPINVVVSKPPKEKDKHPGPDTSAEDRLLIITLKNTTPKPLENVEVKYWLMVKDVKEHDITVGVNDSNTLTLPASGQQVITSSVAKCDYTPRKGPGKEAGAKGSKFYGYGVQVLQGGKIASQVYDPTDVKTEITGEGKKEK